MHIPRLFQLLIGLLISVSGRAQTPQMLAPGIISNDRVFGITLTPDGRTAYFVNSRGGRDTLTLMTSTFRKGQWEPPKPVPFAYYPGVWKDIDPILTADGKTLVFNSTRPRPGADKPLDFDMWAVRQTTKKEWGEPYHLGKVVNSDSSDFYASMTNNGNLYFCSTRKGGFGGIDLYRSELVNGVYQPPVNLGGTINSAGAETNVYVAPNEQYIIFLKRSLPTEGPSGLVISFRRNDQWTIPQRLDSTINSNQGEFTPFVSPDGRTFYFSRLKRTTPFTENIYSIPFNADKYQPSAVLPAEGRTSKVSKQSVQPYSTTDSLQIWEREVLLTEERWDEAIIRKDTALLRKLLKDDFLLIGADGSLTKKEQLIQFVANPEIITDPFRTEEVQVRLAGNVAVVTGRFNQTQHYKGKAYRNAFRYTDVYVRQNGSWKALSAQSTRIPETPVAK